MDALSWFVTVAVVWSGWAILTNVAARGPRGDVLTDLATRITWVYARLAHNLRVEGAENIPRTNTPGPLVVVANHTAGVDPLLIQSVCPFFIRWMMARDMQLPALEIFWKWAEIIPVDREQRDSTSAREAIRHLAQGEVLGIFPEGMLERPAQELLPFVAGVGLIVHRSKAPVLPVIIDGTPQVDPAWSSLWRTSRSTLRFLPIIDYSDSELRPGAIAEDLRQRFAGWTGWPLNDTPPPEFPGGKGKGSRRVVHPNLATRHA